MWLYLDCNYCSCLKWFWLNVPFSSETLIIASYLNIIFHPIQAVSLVVVSDSWGIDDWAYFLLSTSIKVDWPDAIRVQNENFSLIGCNNNNEQKQS